jgi:hypothetical protein
VCQKIVPPRFRQDLNLVSVLSVPKDCPPQVPLGLEAGAQAESGHDQVANLAAPPQYQHGLLGLLRGLAVGAGGVEIWIRCGPRPPVLCMPGR